jgi:hypothetical protein
LAVKDCLKDLAVWMRTSVSPFIEALLPEREISKVPGRVLIAKKLLNELVVPSEITAHSAGIQKVDHFRGRERNANVRPREWDLESH